MTSVRSVSRLAAFAAVVLCAALAAAHAFAQGEASPYSASSRPILPEEFGEDAENYLDPSDFVLDAPGEYFYVACCSSSRILRVKADGSENGTFLPLPFKPDKLRLFPDGTKLAVVGGQDRGRLALINLDKGAFELGAVVKTGHSPTDVAVAQKDGKTFVYVANCYSGTVDELDGETLETVRSWDAGREPYAIELTPDQRRLVIANRITDMPANQSYSFAKVRVIYLDTGEMKVADLYNGHNLLHDIAITADGRYAFVSGVQCSYLSITSQVNGGWISENCVLCVDVEECRLIEIFFLDDAELGSGNPWGVAISEDGERLVVSIAGTDELIYLPLKRLIQMIDERPEWARPGFGAYSYQTFAKGDVQLPFRIRVRLGFKGMRQIIARGNDVYAVCRYDDVICKSTMKLDPPFKHFPDSYVSQEPSPLRENAPQNGGDQDSKSEDAEFAKLLADAAPGENASIPLRFQKLAPKKPMEGVEFERSFARLGAKPVLTMRRRGEILFHDATACLEHWLSCVTCHPDARADGFNWDLLNDGTGNLKNAKSMLLAHETPPCMISGIRPDAEIAVRAGFTHILFMPYKEENACCVDEYLKALKPLPSPRLVDGELSESAKRGKALFESEKIGCATCHPKDSYFTDMRLHRTGTQDPNDFIDKFDTPTLIECWRTAPYLNTGAYTDLWQLFKEGKHGVKDGRFDALSEQEQKDLIEYVLSL